MWDKKEEEIDHCANREENSRQLRFCQTVTTDSEAGIQAEDNLVPSTSWSEGDLERKQLESTEDLFFFFRNYG